MLEKNLYTRSLSGKKIKPPMTDVPDMTLFLHLVRP